LQRQEGSLGCLFCFLHHGAVNNPNPALVTARSARRMPRWALLLLCAAYVLPGLVGRDPWRSADLSAFGIMAAMAEGRTSWWAPTLGGVAADTALLPHWLGAAFIAGGHGLIDPALAARLPFAALLALTLALVWYSTYLLARTEAAQPVAFAFGGEAEPVAYARAMADGGLLALMATLGLLQLGHETTPELAQLFAVSLYVYGLAAAPSRPWRSRWAVLLALPILAASGAPTVAMAVGLGGWLLCSRSRLAPVRSFAAVVLLATLLAGLAAWGLGSWRWRATGLTLTDWPLLARQWLWFMWPAWPLALWTLWRWRQHLLYRHLAVPLMVVLVALASNLAMGGSDRALLLGLPALAVLAAFALPTLKRSASAAIDWFSMCFFSLAAVTGWVLYASVQTGLPAKPAANVARLFPGFVPHFSALALFLAVLGTLAWIWLVSWRTGRHRDALWKSLVLPAGGVALIWLLLMTLGLQLVDHARSPKALVQRLQMHLPAGACVAGPGLPPATVAAMEQFGRWRVLANADAAAVTDCSYLVRLSRQRPAAAPPPGWELIGEASRTRDRDEVTQVLQRRP
jgi:4-amino-4-deoxy-L-arabinose transferase-like glycosyltransferase